jgi:hypothetical protein
VDKRFSCLLQEEIGGTRYASLGLAGLNNFNGF